MTRTVRLALRQALLEQRSFWRSAEYALFTFAFPLMILLLIGAANVGSHLPGRRRWHLRWRAREGAGRTLPQDGPGGALRSA